MASQVTGLNGVLNNLDSTVTAISEASIEALHTVALNGAEDAARRAPVLSGRLRDSFLGAGSERDSVGPEGVHTGTEPRGPFAEIGSKVEYAATIEYRHEPMLRPAAAAMEAELVDQVGENVRRTMSRRGQRKP